ncbi:Outer membrane lipoprotein-sorting protein [Desulfitobacterium chlororespirans DSM 11544]|uniref:Outer membrane lipoprotein-sorting protein n=1 Tax=Desulfitobacterium chlororespirans DSM 11544 TaxID=1121395 RepID=A0A1M7UQN1_9FIRM|nr:Outer membrane lipoprotein-sorting protein [Desulfitobacterium chlororespirans DSM 11544]
MKVRFFLAILIGIAFLTTGCTKSADLNELISMSKDIQELYYEERNSGEIIFDGKVWAKDNQFKYEVTVYSNNEKIDTLGLLTDNSGKRTTYRIQNPNASIAPSTGISGTFQGIREDSFLRYIDRIGLEKAEIVGAEEVEGRQSVIVRTNTSNGVDPSKIWIDKKTGVPTKIEFAENEKIVTSLTYKNIKIGPGSVSDKEFEVPESALILE